MKYSHMTRTADWLELLRGKTSAVNSDLAFFLLFKSGVNRYWLYHLLLRRDRQLNRETWPVPFLSLVHFCLNRKYALGDIRVSVYICTGSVGSGVLMNPRAKATTAVVGQQPGYDDVMAHDGHSGGGRSAAGASPGVAWFADGRHSHLLANAVGVAMDAHAHRNSLRIDERRTGCPARHGYRNHWYVSIQIVTSRLVISIMFSNCIWLSSITNIIIIVSCLFPLETFLCCIQRMPLMFELLHTISVSDCPCTFHTLQQFTFPEKPYIFQSWVFYSNFFMLSLLYFCAPELSPISSKEQSSKQTHGFPSTPWVF